MGYRGVFGVVSSMLALSVTLAGCPLEVYQVPGCRLASIRCDDQNPCTEARCDEDTGACVFDPVPTGTDCGDGDACNGIETCSSAATCEADAPLEIDDTDPCTTDACDPATGIISHEPILGCGEVETFWSALPTADAPSPRVRHTAVWTGSEMIVWGGRPGPGQTTDTGARYDPATDSWSATSQQNAPSPRHSHSAVWTGTEMIVWGGFGASSYETTGGRYDPTTDTWTAISSTGAPQGRTFQTAQWTGTEMIVWGGLNGTSALANGARYDPTSDTWAPMPSPAPASRLKHAAVWTGDRMIVWGGTNTFDWLDTGGVYERASDSWVSITSLTNVPFIREGPSAVWTGADMLIWGGWDGGNFLDDGSLYDPNANSWTAIAGDGPAGRTDHVTVWTSAELFVWGGCTGQSCGTLLSNGGRYDVSADQWTLVGDEPGLSARARATGVWTGSEVIVWGGEGSEILGDGARAILR